MRKIPDSLRRAYQQLEHLYEAVRMTPNSRQEDIEMAFTFLNMMGCSVDGLYGELVEALDMLMAIYSQHCDTFGPNFRLTNLVNQLIVQADAFGEPMRCIVFVQHRVVAHIVQWYIEQDAILRSSVNVRSGIVYATSTPATAPLRVTNSDSKGRMDKFRNGELNTLVFTFVSEEGMDVPAANCVFRFDAVQTPVSLVQSGDRACQKDSNFVVLAESTQDNRTVACIQEAEHHQYNLVTATPFDKSTTNTQASRKRRMEADAQRQKRALAVLNSRLVVCVTPAYTELLNMYVAQCAGELAVFFDKVTFSRHRCAWVCNCVLLAPDLPRLEASAAADSKQDAKTRVAQQMVGLILEDTPML